MWVKSICNGVLVGKWASYSLFLFSMPHSPIVRSEFSCQTIVFFFTFLQKMLHWEQRPLNNSLEWRLDQECFLGLQGNHGLFGCGFHQTVFFDQRGG